jgi:hypothetical protein
MELRDGNVELGPGELIVIPCGVEHRPVAGLRFVVLHERLKTGSQLMGKLTSIGTHPRCHAARASNVDPSESA